MQRARKRKEYVSAEQIGRLFIFPPAGTCVLSSTSETSKVRPSTRARFLPLGLSSTSSRFISIPDKSIGDPLMATISRNGIIKRISLDPSSSFRARHRLCLKSHPIAFGSLHIGMRLKISIPGILASLIRGRAKKKIKCRVKFALTATERQLRRNPCLERQHGGSFIDCFL